jgi:hypothetical protein
MKRSTELKNELKIAGASDSEANELAGLAVSLQQLRSSQSTGIVAKKSGRQTKRISLVPLGLTSVVGLAIGMALAILSQSVLPGSLLYPVQKLSDTVAVSLDPSYRGIVMMKRAQEVKQLVADHASSGIVLATLGDYKTEASVYKPVSTNYATFEYCKSSLQQAAAIAPNSERQAIGNMLSSLPDV